MHFLVKYTEVLVVFGGLPTFFMLATVDLALLRFILPEVQPLLREHFTANRQLEVFVRDQAVAIEIEFAEDMVEFSL